MTGVFSIAIKERSSNELKYSLYFGRIRKIVLKMLFRHSTFIKDGNETQLLLTLSDEQYRQISKEANIREFLVREIIEEFLMHLYDFKQFWKNVNIKWNHRQNLLYSKVRIYLHKLYRLAPVFDYNRAKTNLRILHRFFHRANYWPRISTQLAMVIYITDKNDPLPNKNLRAQNIRVLANCSAYAFYRTRNIMIEKRVLKTDE